MKTLLFHPTTRLLLESLRQDFPQSLLLSGRKGSGLLTTAHWLNEESALVLHPKNAKGDVDDTTGTISVEAIRELYSQTRTKSSIKRIVIIDNAERMSRGAQAAFLKLLEEPNSTTHFILTSHFPEALLPTIRSRVQHFYIQSLTPAQSSELTLNLGVHDPTKQAQLLFLASGLPAELTRLARDVTYFDQHVALINDARAFITADSYQKMRIVHKYRLDRDKSLMLIDSTINVLRFTLNSKPQYKLIEQLGRLLEAREHIAANQSISLQLTHAVL